MSERRWKIKQFPRLPGETFTTSRIDGPETDWVEVVAIDDVVEALRNADRAQLPGVFASDRALIAEFVKREFGGDQ